jgi:hypothetical protein
VAAGDAGLVRDGEQPADAGVILLVQRVAVARDGAVRIARLDERGEGRGIDVTQRDVSEDAGHEVRGRFRRAEDHGAAAEEAGRDRALDRLRRGGERDACGRDGGYEPMLCNCDQRGIEDPALRRRRQLAGDEQPGVIGEGDAADEVTAQVVAAHHDRVRVRGGNGRALVGLRPDFHSARPRSRPASISYTEKRFDFRTC